MTARGRQADSLRKKAPLEGRRDRILVVAGAKGGVGATAVTLAMARDLAARVGPTMVTSACPGRADLSFMGGVTTPRGKRAESIPLDKRLVLYRRALPEEPDGGRFVYEALERLPLEGWLVVDAGVGISPWCVTLAREAGRLMIVTTPDDLSRLNAFGAVKRLSASVNLPPVGLVVNHCADAEQGRAVGDALAGSVKKLLKLEASLAGWLPTSGGDPTEQPIETLAPAA